MNELLAFEQVQLVISEHEINCMRDVNITKIDLIKNPSSTRLEQIHKDAIKSLERIRNAKSIVTTLQCAEMGIKEAYQCFAITEKRERCKRTLWVADKHPYVVLCHKHQYDNIVYRNPLVVNESSESESSESESSESEFPKRKFKRLNRGSSIKRTKYSH